MAATGRSFMPSTKLIGRLSLYRRLLKDAGPGGDRHVFSHELATLAGGTPAQVRRDVMSIGFSGSPARGYDAEELVDAIGRVLDPPVDQGIALVGVGNLGRAMLAYFVGRMPHFSLVAAFDADPERVGRVIHGCRCYPVDQLSDVVREKGVQVAIIAVPSEEAQGIANELCNAGVRGLVNFAPVRLWVPEGVYVEDVDVTMSLERVAYYAQHGDSG
jgi:redox-sensing transcriptional repressor